MQTYVDRHITTLRSDLDSGIINLRTSIDGVARGSTALREEVEGLGFSVVGGVLNVTFGDD